MPISTTHRVKEKDSRCCTDFYHGVFLLEYRPGQGTLTSVIEAVWVGTVLHQELNKVGMAMVSSEH
jgi:hypothetical protein